MSGLMAGKRGLIMGLANDKSLAWGIAKQLHDIALAMKRRRQSLYCSRTTWGCPSAMTAASCSPKLTWTMSAIWGETHWS